MEGHQPFDCFRHLMLRAIQRYRPVIERQAVKARTMFGSEALEPVERTLFIEDLGIAFERVWRVEDAGARIWASR